MGRKTFQKRSRQQNQQLISTLRDQFFGETSDLPGNAIDKKYQISLVNQVCYGSFVKSRDGITDIDDGTWIPPLPFSVYQTSYLFSQSGLAVSASGYTFTSVDIGRYLCYDNKDGVFDVGSNSGSYYQSVKILSLPSGCKITINGVAGGADSYLTNVSVGAGGTGYSNGMVLHIVGGNNDATVTVTGTTNGVVTSVSITNGGSGFIVGDLGTQKNTTTNYVTVDLGQTVTSRIGSLKIRLNGIWYNSFNNVYIAHVGTKLYYCDPGDTSWTELNQVGTDSIPDCRSVIRDNDNLVVVIPKGDDVNGQDAGIWIVDPANEQYWPAALKDNVDAPIKNCPDRSVENGYNRRYLYTKSRFVGNAANYPIFANRNLSTSNTIQHESGATQLGPNKTDSDYTTLGTATANGQLYGSLMFFPTLSYFTPGTVYAFALGVSGATPQTILFTLSDETPVTVDGIMKSFASELTNYFPSIKVESSSTNSNIPIGAIRLTTTTEYLSYFTPPSIQNCSGAGFLNGTQDSGAKVTDYTSSSVTQTNGLLAFNPTTTGFSPSGTYVFGFKALEPGVTWTLRTTNGDSYAVCYGIPASVGTYCAVGVSGLIQVSTDGTNWTSKNIGTFPTYDLLAVTWYSYQGNSKFVAVGKHGTILTSVNGNTWSLPTSGTTTDLTGVTQGSSGALVAIGGREVLTSLDGGSTWTKKVINPCAIAYNGSTLYVMVGPAGLIQTSPNRTVWSSQTSGTTSDLTSVFYVAHVASPYFIAVGRNGSIVTSPDGIIWTSRTVATVDNLKSISWNKLNTASSVVCVVGENSAVAYCKDVTDPAVWYYVPQTSLITGNLNCVSWVVTQFVAVGDSGAMIVSSQASTWTLGSGNGKTTNNLNCVYRPDGSSYPTVIVVGDAGFIMSAPDQTLYSWTIDTSGTSNNLLAISYNTTSTYYAVVGDSGTALKSDDAVHWTAHSLGASKNYISIIPYTNLFAITTQEGLLYGSYDLSSDSLTATISNSNGLFSCVLYSSQYVVAGGYGTILTSADTITWTRNQIGSSKNLYGITFGNSKYIVVGGSGAIFTSSDAISWGQQTTPTSVTTDFLSVAYGNGLYRAVGKNDNGGVNNSPIISSKDGTTWSLEGSGTKHNIYSIIYVDATGDFVAVGDGTPSSIFLIVGPVWVITTIAFVLSAQNPVTVESLVASFGSLITAKYSDVVVAVANQTIQIHSSIRQLDYLQPASVADISGAGALNADSANSGAKLIAITSPAYKLFNDNNIPSTIDPTTHYSVYATEDLNNSDVLTVGNDPNAFALLDDIPLMKSFNGNAHLCGLMVDATGKAIFTTSQGWFSTADVGRIMPIVFQYGVGTAAGNYLVWGKITSLNNPTNSVSQSASVELTTDGVTAYNYQDTFSTFGTPMPAWATIESNYIFDCSLSNKTLTVNNIYSTDNNECNKRPITALTLSQISTPQVGEQLFMDYGDIRIVTASDSTTITVDQAFPGSVTASTMAFRPMSWSYTDSYKDSEISPKIGSLGCKTRFMRAIPWDGVNTFVGEILPGFLVAGCGVDYFYSELPNNYRYLIGDYDPNHQTDKVFELITAFTSHSDALGIFTNKSCYAVQTNLDIDYTDESNGMIVRVLPPPKLIGENDGCGGMAELCHIDDGTYAVILSKTGDICSFDGSSFGPSLVIKKIRLKIFELFNKTIDYDYHYGLMVRGSDYTVNNYENDRFYYVCLPEDFAVGQGEFKDLPMGERGVHFIRNNQTTYLYNGLVMSKAGDVTSGGSPILVRSVPGEFFKFIYTQTYDNFYHRCFSLPIMSTHTTSDDTGSSQAFFIEQKESHIYLNPDGSNTDPSSTGTTFTTSLVVSMTAQNDIGQTVTSASKVSNNDDINFDLKVRGHRIRYVLGFNQAGWMMTGIQNYYMASDKRTPTNASSIEQVGQDVILSPVLGISRYSQLLNIGTGQLLSGTITRLAGPDDATAHPHAYSALKLALPNSGIDIPCPIISPCNFTVTFWYKTTGSGTLTTILYNKTHTDAIQVNSSALKLQYYNGSGGTADLLTILNDGKWHFIKASYTSATTTFLSSIDNEADNTVSVNAATLLTTLMTLLYNTDGELFDLRVFSTILSNADLTYYYNDIINGGNRTLTCL